ncbi:MAG TPA: hypothetical protein VGO62_16780 [Myxococcota bacterium]|jgi:hypothetical protein
MRNPRVAGLAVVTLSALLGCATAPPKASGSGLHARDFFPLAVGNTWKYALQPAPPDGSPNVQVRILEKDAQGFYIDDQKGRLAPRSDGVFDGSKNRFILEEPIEVGHEWIAVPKDDPAIVEHYKIVDVASSVHVPAGTFDGCVDVEASQSFPNHETGEKGTLKTTFSYAPGVGLVRVLEKIIPEKSDPINAFEMDLVSFDLAKAK